MEPKDLIQMIVQLSLGYIENKAKDIEGMILSHLCWITWKERNDQIFQDKYQPTMIILQKGLKSLKENAYICMSLDLTKDLKALKILKSLPLEGPTIYEMGDPK